MSYLYWGIVSRRIDSDFAHEMFLLQIRITVLLMVVAYMVQRTQLELFIDQQKIAQWLDILFEHPDATLIARNDFKFLHTNRKFRELFQMPHEIEAVHSVNPSAPEVNNDWILNLQGTLCIV